MRDCSPPRRDAKGEYPVNTGYYNACWRRPADAVEFAAEKAALVAAILLRLRGYSAK